MSARQQPRIGNNVRMEMGCKRRGGVHPGNNVTIGANSVILNSVEPKQTVFGVPGRAGQSSAWKSE
jgi:serine acetyltransferase